MRLLRRTAGRNELAVAHIGRSVSIFVVGLASKKHHMTNELAHGTVASAAMLSAGRPAPLPRNFRA
jgi:hypothetical protein